jgi:two-component system sensor histidine kinase CiaH
VRLIQSATFKLTLSYLGIIMVLSLLFSWALYRVSSDQITSGIAHQKESIERLPLPLTLESRRTDYLQALDDQLDAFNRTLLIRLAALNLGMLAVGGAISYGLARRTLRPIQDSLEAQGRFTADASHELRTPLTAMRSEIEVALREKQLSPADARKLFSSNLEEIAKLEALSAGLLRLARFENGLDPAVVTEVPVTEIFEGAIDRHQAAIADRHIQLDVRHGSGTIAGDRASLIELVAILLDNAIKYSPAKSTVTLSSKAAAGFATISVADQGPGIKASDIPHIFDRFYRADRSRTKERINGYGLGLSIAKRITDIHHGTITVDSTLERGTTFHVRLPVHYAPKKSFF